MPHHLNRFYKKKPYIKKTSTLVLKVNAAAAHTVLSACSIDFSFNTQHRNTIRAFVYMYPNVHSIRAMSRWSRHLFPLLCSHHLRRKRRHIKVEHSYNTEEIHRQRISYHLTKCNGNLYENCNTQNILLSTHHRHNAIWSESYIKPKRVYFGLCNVEQNDFFSDCFQHLPAVHHTF